MIHINDHYLEGTGLDPVYFRRKPYNVVYKDFHTGELVKIKRRPPQKLHTMLPTDMVELKYKKNLSWDTDSEYQIKHISYRAPNTLQLINDENMTTFVSNSEVDLVEEVAYRRGGKQDQENDNRYLRWP